MKKAAGGAQVQTERGEGTGPRSDAVWPVMPRQEGMDGRYPLAGSPQAGRGRNMQHHGREERCCALPWRDGAALASSAPDKERGFLHSSPQNKDVPQPCRGRPCKFWCERRDLNPYGITTRPSNVRVCRFRHSRRSVLNRCLCSLRTLTIIAKGVVYVKPFFKVFSIFFPLFLSGVWLGIIRFLKPLFCRR